MNNKCGSKNKLNKSYVKTSYSWSTTASEIKILVKNSWNEDSCLGVNAN